MKELRNFRVAPESFTKSSATGAHEPATDKHRKAHGAATSAKLVGKSPAATAACLQPNSNCACRKARCAKDSCSSSFPKQHFPFRDVLGIWAQRACGGAFIQEAPIEIQKSLHACTENVLPDETDQDQKTSRTLIVRKQRLKAQHPTIVQTGCLDHSQRGRMLSFAAMDSTSQFVIPADPKRALPCRQAFLPSPPACAASFDLYQAKPFPDSRHTCPVFKDGFELEFCVRCSFATHHSAEAHSPAGADSPGSSANHVPLNGASAAQPLSSALTVKRAPLRRWRG